MRFLQQLQRFWLALRLTWRGEKVQRTSLALHWDWLEEAERLLRTFIASLKQHPPATNFRLRFDGRELRPTTALRWLAFSFQRELPSLLRSGNLYARAAFQAQVLNLRDMLSAWHDNHAPVDVKTTAALSSLIEHLNDLPSDDNGATVVATPEMKRYTAPQESPLSEREMPAMPPKPEDSGQSLLEYALILVLVAVVIIVILVLLGPTIREIINNIVNSIAT